MLQSISSCKFENILKLVDSILFALNENSGMEVEVMLSEKTLDTLLLHETSFKFHIYKQVDSYVNGSFVRKKAVKWKFPPRFPIMIYSSPPSCSYWTFNMSAPHPTPNWHCFDVNVNSFLLNVPLTSIYSANGFSHLKKGKRWDLNCTGCSSNTANFKSKNTVLLQPKSISHESFQ